MKVFRLVKPNARVVNPRLTDLIASSTYPTPKIWTKGNPAHAGTIFVNWQSSLSLPLGTTKLIDSIPHPFKYIPSVFGTFKFDNGTVKREGALPLQVGSIGMILLDADMSNINLKYYSIDLAGVTVIPAFTMTVRYYVMVEPGL